MKAVPEFSEIFIGIALTSAIEYIFVLKRPQAAQGTMVNFFESAGKIPEDNPFCNVSA